MIASPNLCGAVGYSANVRGAKLLAKLSPLFPCARCTPFAFLYLLGFPGPNYLRAAGFVHNNLLWGGGVPYGHTPPIPLSVALLVVS